MEYTHFNKADKLEIFVSYLYILMLFLLYATCIFISTCLADLSSDYNHFNSVDQLYFF